VGELPPELGHLVDLQTLNLRQNLLHFLPAELAPLPHLTYVNSNGNPFYNTLEVSIFNLLAEQRHLGVQTGIETAGLLHVSAETVETFELSQEFSKVRPGKKVLSLKELCGRQIIRLHVEVDFALLPPELRAFLRDFHFCTICSECFLQDSLDVIRLEPLSMGSQAPFLYRLCDDRHLMEPPFHP